MNGPEFAEEARARNPERKVIFMSGYPAEAAQHNGFLDSGGIILLSKPFQRSQIPKEPARGAVLNSVRKSPFG